MLEKEVVIAIDPGTKKCGYALVDSDFSVLQREVIQINKIVNNIEDSLKVYKINKIVLGGGTNYKKIEKKIKDHFPDIDIVLIKEDFSTLEARKKYFESNPPRGIFKLIPLSLRVPTRDYDDFVSVLLAEKYFRNSK